MTSPGRARMGTSAHDTVPPIFYMYGGNNDGSYAGHFSDYF